MKNEKIVQNDPRESSFLQTPTSKPLFALTITMALIYLWIIAFWFPRGNTVLFILLIVGEIFHLWQAVSYIHTVWNTDYKAKNDEKITPFVDVFITVAGEPADVVEKTLRAALNMDYPNFFVYILNDGFVAKKENWKEIELLAEKLGASCITRKTPGGAKAGNINNALKLTGSPLVAVFDADQVPKENFLKKMAGYFVDQKMGFVQSPQYYENYGLNDVTNGAWEQQELFFGPICKGKNRLNSVFMCGTNMLVSRKALLQAGGMCETNIAEDFLTSLYIHKNGWKSAYVDEVLVKGLAPEDFLSYYKQQYRWARGSLELLFRHNALTRKPLKFNQEIQYVASASYYLSGIVVLINALLPLAFFYFGIVPLKISTMGLAAVFIPYIFLVLFTLRSTSNNSYTFKALSFSMSSFIIHIQALFAVLTNQKTGFSVTSKKQLEGNFWHLVIPHILYIMLVIYGIEIAILRNGISAQVLTNTCWALFNVAVFMPFIIAANPGWFKALKQPRVLKIYRSQPAKETVKAGRPEVPKPDFSIAERK